MQNETRATANLLRELAEALAAFRSALCGTGRWSHTLVMTYSEFGRRVRENGSLGTDHGTAAPQLLLGGRVRGGLYGRQPSLTELADGNLRHHVHFRSLYATIARHWWGLRADFLGADRHAPLDCLA